MAYDVRFTPEAQRHLTKLPEKVKAAILEFASGPLAANPRKVGKPLHDELERLLSARREDYRIIYEVDDSAQLVIVHRTQHRGDVYRRR